MKKRMLAVICSFLLFGSGCSLFDSISQGSASHSGSGCAHRDTENNGYCDKCNEDVTVTVDFYGLNDLHGKFSDSDEQPGVDELTTYLKMAKANNENTILLSSGDMWQGGSESNLTKGLILTDWMNELDFVSMTLGNHEYDWGEEYIEANADLAEFPLLALNIYDSRTDKPVDYCQPSVMVERGGAKIGIIGAIGDCYSSISSDKVEDVYFKTGSELTKLVKKESEALRKQGADFIVYSVHDGHGSSTGNAVTNVSDGQLRSYYDISLSDGYVDLVFEGHSHQRYVLKDSKGVYHLQDGGDNDGISHAQVRINIANDTSKMESAEFISTDRYATTYEDDAIVEELLAKYKRQIELGGQELGFNDYYRSSRELCELVAKLYFETGVKTWGEDYDVVLGGGFLQARSPYNLSAGTVTYGDLMSLLPFDNQIVLCSVSGKKLRRQFMETNNANYHIYTNLYSSAIQDEDIYYIVTDTYTSQYAPNGLTEVARLDETTFARDLLAEYIKAGGMTTNSSDIVLTSFEEIYAIAETLANNAQTAETYYIKGKVESIASTTYGNMVLVDEDGNSLYIYGVYDKTGTKRYDSMSTPPQVGDTIILRGVIKKYVPDGGSVLIEMVSGKLQSIEE